VKYNLNLNTQQNQTPQPPTQAPLLPQVGDDGFESQAFDNWVWTPYLEIGLQTESMFDIFYSFSTFNFGNNFGKTVPAQIYPIANSFTDYYAFESSDPDNNPNPLPPANNFTSIRTPIDPTVLIYTYTINPNLVWRQFNVGPFRLNDPDAVLTPAISELVSEHINVDLKATIFENRLAGRAKSSFGPYFGFTPELGVSLGGVFTLLYYRIETKTSIIELGNPSNVLYAWTGGQSDKQWSFGGFASVDLRMNLPNTFFGCSFDYSYMTDIRYSLQDIQCFINPGGRSLNFFWGLRF